jgi:gliding motility-associated-like protein
MTLKFFPLLALAGILAADVKAQCNHPFSLNSSPATICSGRDMQLTATSYPGATYTWTGPAGSGPGGPVLNLTNVGVVSHSGTYTVTMTYNGCTYSQSVTIFVEKTPEINSVSHPVAVCPGEDVAFIANAGSATGATYNWVGPNWIFSSSVTNVAFRNNMQTIDGGGHTVTVVSTSGCATDPYPFNVQVHPEVKSNFNVDIRLGCKEDSVGFTNTSTGQITNSWLFGDGNVSFDHSPLHIYKAQGSYTVKLVTSNGLCFDTLQQQVNFNHSIDANFTVNDDSICQNTTVNFTNGSAYVPAIIPTYAWDFKDGGEDAVADPAYLFKNAGEYDVRLIATDYLGCKDTAYKKVIVDSAGSISFETSDDALCAGKSIKLSGTFMQIGNTGTTWNMDDGNILTGKDAFEYNYDEAGVYNVTFNATYRICPNASFTKAIIIKPIPRVNLGPDTSICQNGKPLIINDRENEGNPNAKWNWNSLETDKGSSIIVRHPGTYAATVEIDGCEATDTVLVTSDCYINIPNVFSPNGDGSSDYFLPRQMLSKGVTDFRMTIFNRWGQKIFVTNSAEGRGWDGNFNGEPQPLGVYVYLVEVAFANGTRENYQGNVTLLR